MWLVGAPISLFLAWVLVGRDALDTLRAGGTILVALMVGWALVVVGFIAASLIAERREHR